MKHSKFFGENPFLVDISQKEGFNFTLTLPRKLGSCLAKSCCIIEWWKQNHGSKGSSHNSPLSPLIYSNHDGAVLNLLDFIHLE